METEVPKTYKEKIESKVCKFWLSGVCSKGYGCNFLHSGEQNIGVCVFFATGKCKYGSVCKYKHDVDIVDIDETKMGVRRYTYGHVVSRGRVVDDDSV
jgi:hypothetical protein